MDSPVQQTCTSTPSATGSVLGRLTGVGTSASTTNYMSISNRGWILSSQQTTAGQTAYVFPSYTYYLNGALSSVTYPSGRQVSYGLDSAGRVSSVSGNFNGQNDPY